MASEAWPSESIDCAIADVDNALANLRHVRETLVHLKAGEEVPRRLRQYRGQAIQRIKNARGKMPQVDDKPRMCDQPAAAKMPASGGKEASGGQPAAAKPAAAGKYPSPPGAEKVRKVEEDAQVREEEEIYGDLSRGHCPLDRLAGCPPTK